MLTQASTLKRTARTDSHKTHAHTLAHKLHHTQSYHKGANLRSDRPQDTGWPTWSLIPHRPDVGALCVAARRHTWRRQGTQDTEQVCGG